MKRSMILAVLVSSLTSGLAMFALTTSRADDAPKTDELQQTLVQLADARLKLAETSLQLAQADNKRVPGVISDVILARMQQGVANAQARVTSAKQKANDFSLEVLVPSAELEVESLTTRLKALDELVARSDDQIVANHAQTVRGQLEVAKLELASLKLMKGRSLNEQVQWQLNELSSAVDSLTTRVIVLENDR